ncbi:hypothetical protein EAE96_000450 [Botrytis aclada]|nr:hypothetical protein EAE96_000450 [Botrytis aclada]
MVYVRPRRQIDSCRAPRARQIGEPSAAYKRDGDSFSEGRGCKCDIAVKGEGGEERRSRDRKGDYLRWSHLERSPIPGGRNQSSMDFPGIPTVRRNNLSAFIARLASVGVRDPELCVLALWILRDTLETPRSLTRGAEDPNHASSEQDLPTIAELLPTALAWFQYCGHKIESLCLHHQDYESSNSEIGELAKSAQMMPSSGFSVARWMFWRERLEEISGCGDEDVAALAVKAWKTMKFWGERVESLGGTVQDME